MGGRRAAPHLGAHAEPLLRPPCGRRRPGRRVPPHGQWATGPTAPVARRLRPAGPSELEDRVPLDPTPVDATLFASLDPPRLAGSRCSGCGTVTFPATSSCPRCMEPSMAPYALP